MDKLDTALKNSGDNGFVTIEALAKEFTTPAWADLAKENSPLNQILTTPYFKKANLEHDQIDVDYLRLMGLLHCAGKPRDKAVAFYSVL